MTDTPTPTNRAVVAAQTRYPQTSRLAASKRAAFIAGWQAIEAEARAEGAKAEYDRIKANLMAVAKNDRRFAFALRDAAEAILAATDEGGGEVEDWRESLRKLDMAQVDAEGYQP